MIIDYILISMDLDKEKVLRLIEEYGKKAILWDPKHPFYLHKQKKIDAWYEIADTFNISVNDVKQKINSLLGSLRREKAKGKKTLGTGKGVEEVYISNWYGLQSFSFLLDKDLPRTTLCSENMPKGRKSTTTKSKENVNHDGQPQNNDDVQHDDSINVQPENDVDIQLANASWLAGAKSPVSVQPEESKVKRKRRKRNEEDPLIELAYKFLQAPIEQSDSTQIFANYVAAKLNEFDTYTKSVLTHQITNLIFEAEMSKLGKAQMFGDKCLPNQSSPCTSMTSIPASASPPPQSQHPVATAKSAGTNEISVGVELSEYVTL